MLNAWLMLSLNFIDNRYTRDGVSVLVAHSPIRLCQIAHEQGTWTVCPPSWPHQNAYFNAIHEVLAVVIETFAATLIKRRHGAIFLIFTRNRPWKSEDHLCTLFFIEMSKESLEKSERTPPVSWRPWALAYSRDRPYNFSCLSAVSKNRRFRSFFSALGCHLARKSLSWPAMSVSNKKQEFEQRKRIKLFDDFWVRAYRFDFAPRRRPRARSI